MFVAIALVIPATLLVFLPINLTVGVVVAVVLFASCCGILLATAPTIEVLPGEIRAGRATLPLKLCSGVEAFFGQEATLERGQRLDARAWLLLRGWISPVARVRLSDPSDPTPYWLVSTRTPDRFAAAVQRAKETGI